MSSAVATKSRLPMVGMGETVTIASPEVAHAVLGSCIGLALYDRKNKIGALAHIVLPSSNGRPGSPGKFADTAIPHMIELLKKEGAFTSKLSARVVGGANMFKTNGPMQVGTANAKAVRQVLSELKIAIVGEHVGGQKGRRISFDAVNGGLVVEVMGESPVVLC